MKNRKSSAMWGVAIVLILGFAYFMNATSWLSKPLFPEAPKPVATTEGPTEEQTRNSLVKAEQSRVLEATSEGGPINDTGLPPEPALFKKKQVPYKPIPNPTSTSAHWDDKDSYSAKQSEETKDQRGF